MSTVDQGDRTRVEGFCTADFEAVRDLFVERCDFGGGGGAFCAYVGGEKVVDLWSGSARPGAPWGEDTLAVLASATKGMTTLCAHVLFSRGELDIEAPVAYWPEFASNGKGAITVRQVLEHSSGVIGVADHERLLRLDGTGWGEHEKIAAGIAASEPAWEPGSQVGYHALTFGWIVGEIVRRITGRTLGRVFADEVATPLALDAYLGTPSAHLGRVAEIIDPGFSEAPAELRPMIDAMLALARDPQTLTGRALFASGGQSLLEVGVGPLLSGLLEVEVPSSSGTSTARSLARIYAVLASGGELDGTKLVSAESIGVFRTPPDGLVQVDVLPGFTPPRALGYHTNFSMPGGPLEFGPSPSAFGHHGFGGQVGCCDPEAGVAIGFVRSRFAGGPTFSSELIQAVYDHLR